MEDFRRKALQLEDIRLRREMYNVMQDFAAVSATIVLLMTLCYAILVLG